MPTIRFEVYNPKAGEWDTALTVAICSSPWDVFQLLNANVRIGGLSTISVRKDNQYIYLADPGTGWHKKDTANRLLILPKHSEDMEEMEAFAVELWELACRLTEASGTLTTATQGLS